jgi:hypothetical protein
MITLAYLQVLLQLHHILNGWELQRLRGASPSYLREGPPNLICHKRKRSSHARDGDGRQLRKFAEPAMPPNRPMPSISVASLCLLLVCWANRGSQAQTELGTTASPDRKREPGKHVLRLDMAGF